MDRQTKLFLGFILGEIYRTQRRLDENMTNVGEATLYGLLNGIESAVDSILDSLEGIGAEKVTAVEDVLSEYWHDPEKLETLHGYYDIEPKLKALGVGRGEAAVIMRYLKAQGRFEEEIRRMDSNHSPAELRSISIDPSEL